MHLLSLSFATGAEEKVIRVFNATQNFVENLQRLNVDVSVTDLLNDKVQYHVQAITHSKFVQVYSKIL